MNVQRMLGIVCLLAGWLTAHAAWTAPPTIESGSWTLGIIPDTQYYTHYNNGVFEAQTQYLANQKSALNLKYVLHEGDIVQSNENASHWTRASAAMATLDNAGIPYSLTTGNHDYYNNSETRSSQLSTYFPKSRLEERPTFGGVYSGEPALTNNTYSFFSAGGIDWLVIAMEYGPRDFILDWADGLMKANPHRKVMIVTHSHLWHDGARMDWATHGASQTGNPHDNDGDGIADNQGFTLLPGGVNDGQEVWTALKDNPNLLFIFNGHSTNPAYPRPSDPYGVGGYLASTADDGHTVHQMIANYQAMASDNGYLRLLEFQADGDVFVRTYSPNKGTYLTTANQQFTITVSELLPIPGDANGDRMVDETDAQALADHWGQGSATWQMGDFDRNGFVNAADASILAAHWGYGTSESSAATVPEPSAISMMVMGLFLATYGRSWARGRQ